MRILTFLHSFGPGGVERVALRLSGAWADAGHDVRLLMGRDEGPEKLVAPHNVVYDYAPPHPLAKPFETLWMVRQLVAAVKRHRPDVLFCSGNTYTIVAALVRLILRSECPPIVCKISNSLGRGDLPSFARAGYRLWLRQHTRFIDRFVGLSEPMRSEIENILDVEAERVAIIPNPVLTAADIEELSGSTERREIRDGRRFVAVGRLTRQKNYALLLRAFARIARPDDHLLIAGDGPERKRLMRKAARLGIANSVDFAGHAFNVSGLLKTADVFVSSSNYEGLPGAVVEALAAGMPIVATESSACLSALLRYGQLGKLVSIRDVEGLATALQETPHKETLPISAMRSAASQYTVEKSASLYLDVLAAAAERRSQTSRWPSFEPFAEAA